ncbi:MAG: phosphoglucosamine mutase [Clostridiales bacterium]|nr:phosphoglucosamine mutase [Clostridiales bacterium]
MLFGTDGVRGIASYFFENRLAYNLGRAIVSRRRRPQRVVIARDTRTSGYDIEQEVIKGLIEYGADVYRLEIMPTMTVSDILRQLGADYGIMVSASHNPPEYNGIKIFDSTGGKLSLKEEGEVEAEYYRLCGITKKHRDENTPNEEKRKEGHTELLQDAALMYADGLLKRTEADLTGCTVKLDCCYGACAKTAPDIFKKAGANVRTLAGEYDGRLINVFTGSTNIDFLRANMSEDDYIGCAFDGDGDRMLAVTPKGFIVDGDYILYILTMYLKERGLLRKNSVVGTLMTNYGLEKALNSKGVTLVRTDVGDKYVIEKMKECGYSLGGETSGHIIIDEQGRGGTGDGILAALMLVKALKDARIEPDEIPSLYASFPQKTVNIKTPDRIKKAVLKDERLKALKELCGEEMKGGGRILIRPSGTEEKIRITVEASERETVDDVLGLLVPAYTEAVTALSRKPR